MNRVVRSGTDAPLSASYDATSNGEQHEQNVDGRRRSSRLLLAGCAGTSAQEPEAGLYP
jgi:hypothetical protein